MFLLVSLFALSIQSQLTYSVFNNPVCNGNPNSSMIIEVGKCYTNSEICKIVKDQSNLPIPLNICTPEFLNRADASVLFDCGERSFSSISYKGSSTCSGSDKTESNSAFKDGQCLVTSPNTFEKITCIKPINNGNNPKSNGMQSTLSFIVVLIIGIHSFA